MSENNDRISNSNRANSNSRVKKRVKIAAGILALLILISSVSSVLAPTIDFEINSFYAEDYTADVGEKIIFHWDIQGNFTSIYINWGDGSEEELFNPDDSTGNHSYSREGIYNVTIRVFNAVGNKIQRCLGIDDQHPNGRQIVIKNEAPVFDFFFSKETPFEDEPIDISIINLEESDYDIQPGILTYIYDFGDGQTANGTFNLVSHKWTNIGEYPVSVTVIDDQGALDQKTKTITVLNKKPTAAFTLGVEVPATYTFANDIVGKGNIPFGWIEASDGARDAMYVMDSKSSHSKVVAINIDENYSYDNPPKIKTVFSNQKYGTVELFFMSSNVNQPRGFISLLSGTTEAISVFANNSKWFYTINGVKNEITLCGTPQNETWTHVRIDFVINKSNLPEGQYFGITNNRQFQVIIDGKLSGIKSLSETINDINTLVLGSLTKQSGETSFDSIGFSWDLNYKVGDNYNYFASSYYATHDFRHDTIGTKPQGWDVEDTSAARTQEYYGTHSFEGGSLSGFTERRIYDDHSGSLILPNHYGHEDVLALWDENDDGCVWQWNNFDTPKVTGTVEWWWCSNSHKASMVLLSNGEPDNYGLGPKMWTYNYYYTMDGNNVAPYSINKWDHHKIEFNCTNHKYKWWINGIYYGEFAFFLANPNELTRMTFATYPNMEEYCAYFDAIGYSWDPNYNIGDNLKSPYDITIEDSGGDYKETIKLIDKGTEERVKMTDNLQDNYGNQTKGTIQWYAKSNDINQKSWTLSLMDGFQTELSITIVNGKFQYCIGGTYSEFIELSTPQNNLWYSLSLSFNEVSGKFTLTVNDTESTPLSLRGGFDKISKIMIESDNSAKGIAWIDALGYSWDPHYKLGDNKVSMISYPEKTNVLFSAVDSLDTENDLNSLKFYWDFDDGTSGYGKYVKHEFKQSGKYNVSLAVKDDNGEIDFHNQIVLIHNSYPTIDIENNNETIEIYEGQTIAVNCINTDEITDWAELIYLWDFNISKYYGLDGYYLGTYSFDNDIDGSNPADWLIEENGNSNVNVVNECYSHKKVAVLNDVHSAYGSRLYQNINTKNSGTIEFYALSTSDTRYCNIRLQKDGVDMIQLIFYYEGSIRYHDGSSWQNIQSYSANMWYHFKIEFGGSKWYLWIDGISKDGGNGYNYRNSFTGINHIQFHTDFSSGHYSYSFYIDAIGYSWDPNYKIGSNRDEIDIIPNFNKESGWRTTNLYEDDFEGKVGVKIKDPEGAYDTSFTNIIVKNVNPLVSIYDASIISNISFEVFRNSISKEANFTFELESMNNSNSKSHLTFKGTNENSIKNNKTQIELSLSKEWFIRVNSTDLPIDSWFVYTISLEFLNGKELTIKSDKIYGNGSNYGQWNAFLNPCFYDQSNYHFQFPITFKIKLFDPSIDDINFQALYKTNTLLKINTTTDINGLSCDYLSTYSFTDDAIGSNPSGWTVSEHSGTGVQIIGNLDLHNKVVEAYDGSTGAMASIYNDFTGQEHGTIEFWYRVNDKNNAFDFTVSSGDTGCAYYGVRSGYIASWYSNSWHNIVAINSNQWYRLKIEFECGSGSHYGLSADYSRLYVNGIQYGNYPFNTAAATLSRLRFITNNGPTGLTFYVDAVGYSWDSSYTLGDNLVSYEYYEYKNSILYKTNLYEDNNEIYANIIVETIPSEQLFNDNIFPVSLDLKFTVFPLIDLYEIFQMELGLAHFSTLQCLYASNYINASATDDDLGFNSMIVLLKTDNNLEFENLAVYIETYFAENGSTIRDILFYFEISDFDQVADQSTFNVSSFKEENVPTIPTDFTIYNGSLNENYGNIEYSNDNSYASFLAENSIYPRSESNFTIYDGKFISSGYVLYEGYKKATYSFENDIDGSNPSGWIIEEHGGSDVNVINEFYSHNKVVKLNDIHAVEGSRLYQNFDTKNSGTVEFYALSTSDTKYCNIRLQKDGFDMIQLIFYYEGSIRYYSGGWQYIQSYSANTWYHFKIEFGGSKWYLWIDSVSKDGGNGYNYANTFTGINHLQFHTDFSSGHYTYSFYVDAIGYSWDPNYNIGDNINDFDENPIKFDDMKYFDSIYSIIKSSEYDPYSYQGTFSFENNGDGYNPSGWTVVENDGSDVNVVNEFYSHKKVVVLNDVHSAYGSQLYQNIDTKNSGTIEFYALSTSNSKYCNIRFQKDGVDIVQLILYLDGTIRYHDGSSWQNIQSYSANRWYHFKIEFGGSKWHLWIDGVSKDGGNGYNYRNSFTGINHIGFHTDFSSGHYSYSFYIDAIGYSWDPNYCIGDNKLTKPVYLNSSINLYLDNNINLNNMVLRYSYKTNITQPIEFSIYNYNYQQWDVIETQNFDSFIEKAYNVNSSYYDSNYRVKLNFFGTNPNTEFELIIEKLKITFGGNLINFTSEFVRINNDKELKFARFFCTFNMYESLAVNFSLYNYYTNSWDKIKNVYAYIGANQFQHTILNTEYFNNSQNVLVKIEVFNKNSDVYFNLDLLKIEFYSFDIINTNNTEYGYTIDYFAANASRYFNALNQEYITFNSTHPNPYHFPATYSFENDEYEFQPNGWTINCGSGCYANIVSTPYDRDDKPHDKVLDLYDNGEYGPEANVYTSFEDQVAGNIEFWWMSTYAGKICEFFIYDQDIGRVIYIDLTYNGYIRIKNGGSWQDIQTYASNRWYHFRVSFNCTSGWNLYINGELKAENRVFENTPVAIDKILFSTHETHAGYHFYIDAVDISSDPNYILNRNFYPIANINQTFDLELEDMNYHRLWLFDRCNIEYSIKTSIPQLTKILIYNNRNDSWDEFDSIITNNFQYENGNLLINNRDYITDDFKIRIRYYADNQSVNTFDFIINKLEVNYTWSKVYENYGNNEFDKYCYLDEIHSSNSQYWYLTNHSYDYQGQYLISTYADDGVTTTITGDLIEIIQSIPYSRILAFPNETFEDEIMEFNSEVLGSGKFINETRYLWDWGDGYYSYEANPSHAWSKSGTYTITLFSKDCFGNTFSDNATIIVKDKPTEIKGPFTFYGVEGKAITLDIEVCDSIIDEMGLQYRYYINENELIFDYNKPSIVLEEGEYHFRFEVEDSEGHISIANISIIVENAPPIVLVSNYAYYGAPGQGAHGTPGVGQLNLRAYAYDSYYDMNDMKFNWMIYSGNESYSVYTGSAHYSSITYKCKETRVYSGIVRVTDPSGATAEASFGISSFIDSNSNGLSDEFEAQLALYNKTYELYEDPDDDGLINEYEWGITQTSHTNPDTDGDSLYDGINPSIGLGELSLGTDPRTNDTDSDTLLDSFEFYGWTIVTETNENISVSSNPCEFDTDFDELNDYQEYITKTDPRSPDTDKDGLLDGCDPHPTKWDGDDDNLNDKLEIELGTDPNNTDTDQDGLTDGQEVLGWGFYTNPLDADSDDDFLADNAETKSYKFELFKKAKLDKPVSLWFKERCVKPLSAQLAFTIAFGEYAKNDTLDVEYGVKTVPNLEIEIIKVENNLIVFNTTTNGTEARYISQVVDLKQFIEKYNGSEIDIDAESFDYFGEYIIRINDTSADCLLEQYEIEAAKYLDPNDPDYDKDGIMDGVESGGLVYSKNTIDFKSTYYAEERSYEAPQAWWTLDNPSMGAGIAKDFSGNGLDGALTNMEPENWKSGKVGPYALSFDGTNEYVDCYTILEDINEGAFGDNSQEFTVTAWINASDLSNTAQSSHGTKNCFAAKASATTSDNFEAGLNADGTVRVYINTESHDTYANLGTPGDIVVGEWTFVVIRYHFGTLFVQINNKTYESTLWQTGNTDLEGAQDAHFTLGGTLDGTGAFFERLLDDVRVYNRALDDENIAWIYNNGMGRTLDPAVSGSPLTVGNSTEDIWNEFQIEIPRVGKVYNAELCLRIDSEEVPWGNDTTIGTMYVTLIKDELNCSLQDVTLINRSPFIFDGWDFSQEYLLDLSEYVANDTISELYGKYLLKVKITNENFSLNYNFTASEFYAETDTWIQPRGLQDSKGWITDPAKADTDGDGWNDYYEIHVREIGEETNPCSVDTDGDGAWDPNDRDPLRDLIVKIKFLEGKYNHEMDTKHAPKLQGVVEFEVCNQEFYFTTETVKATSSDNQYDVPQRTWFDHKYFFNVEDDVKVQGNSVHFDFELWWMWPIDEDGNHLGDKKLFSEDYNYFIGSVELPKELESNGHKIKVQISTLSIEKCNTIAIFEANSTFNGHYLEQERTNVIQLYVTDAAGPFKSGPNAIVIPTSLFTKTKLNSYLQKEQLSQTPLYTAGDNSQFISADRDEGANADGSINKLDFVIIRKDISAADAVAVLNLLLICLTNESLDEFNQTIYLETKLLDFVCTTWNGTEATSMNLAPEVLKYITWDNYLYENSAQGRHPTSKSNMATPTEILENFWKDICEGKILDAFTNAYNSFMLYFNLNPSIGQIMAAILAVANFLIMIVLTILGPLLWLLVRTALLILIYIALALIVAILTLFIGGFALVLLPFSLIFNGNLNYLVNELKSTFLNQSIELGYDILFDYNGFLQCDIPYIYFRFLFNEEMFFDMTIKIFPFSFEFNFGDLNFFFGLPELDLEDFPSSSITSKSNLKNNDDNKGINVRKASYETGELLIESPEASQFNFEYIGCDTLLEFSYKPDSYINLTEQVEIDYVICRLDEDEIPKTGTIIASYDNDEFCFVGKEEIQLKEGVFELYVNCFEEESHIKFQVTNINKFIEGLDTSLTIATFFNVLGLSLAITINQPLYYLSATFAAIIAPIGLSYLMKLRGYGWDIGKTYKEEYDDYDNSYLKGLILGLFLNGFCTLVITLVGYFSGSHNIGTDIARNAIVPLLSRWDQFNIGHIEATFFIYDIIETPLIEQIFVFLHLEYIYNILLFVSNLFDTVGFLNTLGGWVSSLIAMYITSRSYARHRWIYGGVITGIFEIGLGIGLSIFAWDNCDAYYYN